jgi:hypothetical protein
MYKITLKSRNKDQFKLVSPTGEIRWIEVNDFMKVGDVLYVENDKLKLLTDDHPLVTMNHPLRKQLVPYGTFLPIQTPPTITTP